ncbi:MAG: phosphodiesterase [Steroidobacteraceae bacterium]
MARHVRLVQFTDTHLFGDAAEDLRGVASLPALRACVAHAGAAIQMADALLVTGDVVQDDPAGYAHLRDVLAPLGRPVLCLPGNHDEVATFRRELGRAPFVLDPHVDLEGWRIVLLDSVKPGAAAGRLAPQALAALDDSLRSAGDRHVMICLHHQPVSMQSRWLDGVGLENADEFFAIVDRCPQVRAIAWGHVHQAWDGERRGVRLLSTPATCRQFLPQSDDFAVDTRPPAYRILDLAPDGTVATEVVWLDRFSNHDVNASADVA